MSALRRSSAGLLALALFSGHAAAQSTDLGSGAAPAAARTPTPSMPAAPAMPQVPAVAGGDDVVATPFGPMSRSSVGAAPAAPAPRPAKTSAPAAGTSSSKTADKASKTPPKPTASAPAEAPPAAPEPPPAVIVAPAPAPVPAVPAASAEAPRPWLRDKPKEKEQPAAAKEETKTSPWRALLALLVVAGLGGFAFVARQRRSKTQALPPGASRIVVLSTAKIGPKANAVVAEVGGRVFLLGVTDSAVSRLAVLDRGPRRAPSAGVTDERRQSITLSNDVDADDARDALLRSRRSPVETADADEPSHDRPLSTKFGEMLDRALGVKSPAGVPDFRGNPAVAALLAGDVEDVVDTAPRKRAAEPAPRQAALVRGRTITAEVVEEQVAGLSRSRRRS